MSTTPASGESKVGAADAAGRLGIKPGMVVMEIGWDEDTDDDLRAAIEDAVGDAFVGDDSDEIVDCVLLWFRDDDGDLVDALVDAIAPLADSGFIWLVTPKRGRAGYVEPSDIAEAAATAGLSQTSMATIGPEWAAARLVGRKGKSSK